MHQPEQDSSYHKSNRVYSQNITRQETPRTHCKQHTKATKSKWHSQYSKNNHYYTRSARKATTIFVLRKTSVNHLLYIQRWAAHKKLTFILWPTWDKLRGRWIQARSTTFSEKNKQPPIIHVECTFITALYLRVFQPLDRSVLSVSIFRQCWYTALSLFRVKKVPHIRNRILFTSTDVSWSYYISDVLLLIII